ncbi:MAG: methionyl-tRNA formyltransferase [Gammaproteobacteria bacterium]|nr:methionyl-tRNA formyltransferase [Gammaproteobacteria bacterium]
MRIIVNGQQAFGKAVLEALLDRGEEVVGVYCEPDKEGRPVDPIKEAALERNLPVFQPKSYRKSETHEQMASLKPDLCVMAYVTLFVPEEALNIPSHGSIQYHPSLLPLHRGPSSINWPIIWGEKKTGLSIFWPDDGLDEGPILIQKEVEIKDEDTLGSLYFDSLFPMGVEAMLEGVDLVRDGKAPKVDQDHSKATYEGWCKGELVRINWHMPLQTTWNLVRGANPQPGAWTTFDGNRLSIFDSEKIREPKSVQPGQVISVGGDGVAVAAADGQLLVKRVRPDGAKKMAAAEWAEMAGVKPGARLK